MKGLFAILICTLTERKKLFDRLMAELDRQRVGEDVIIIYKEDQRQITTGQKRNELLEAAREQEASHVAFFDDDDIPGPTYIQRNMECVKGGYDVNELWGQYYEHGKQMNPFHHSIIHKEWWQDSKFYYRMPNHLNCIKLEHLNGITFQDKVVGEDAWYSIDVQKTGRLKNEYPVKEITYYYFAGKRNHALEPGMALNRGTAL